MPQTSHCRRMVKQLHIYTIIVSLFFFLLLFVYYLPSRVLFLQGAQWIRHFGELFLLLFLFYIFVHVFGNLNHLSEMIYTFMDIRPCVWLKIRFYFHSTY